MADRHALARCPAQRRKIVALIGDLRRRQARNTQDGRVLARRRLVYVGLRRDQTVDLLRATELSEQ